MVKTGNLLGGGGGGGGGEEKGEGSRGENPVLMKAMIFFIVSHLHFEKQMALNRTN